MKTNSISHKDVIDRFVSYGESNFERRGTTDGYQADYIPVQCLS